MGACQSTSNARPDSTNICLQPKGRRTSACHGDSGGPVVCETGEGWKVFGVASFVDINIPRGLVCDTSKMPNVYTRVHEFRDWIQATMQGLPPPASAVKSEPNPECTCPWACSLFGGTCWLPHCRRLCAVCK